MNASVSLNKTSGAESSWRRLISRHCLAEHDVRHAEALESERRVQRIQRARHHGEQAVTKD